MPPERRAVVTPQFVIGFAALSVGLLLLAGNLGYESARGALRYWPAALILLGLLKLVQARALGGALAGVIWMAAGAWLLATNIGVVRVTLWHAIATYWPLALVALGLSIVRQTLRRGAVAERALDSRKDVHMVAVLGGTKGASGSRAFRGGELTAVLGGVDLDLTHAAMDGPAAVIDVFTMWGGLELRVPDGWIVDNQMTVALGGYEDRTRPVGDPDAPRLVLRGTTVMGGVEVRN